MSAWRVGTSKAESSPKKTASPMTQWTVTRSRWVRIPSSQRLDQHHGLQDQHEPVLVHPVGDHAAVQGESRIGSEPSAVTSPTANARVGELQHQPPLGHHLDPGPAEGHELADEEQPEVPMPQRGEERGGRHGGKVIGRASGQTAGRSRRRTVKARLTP